MKIKNIGTGRISIGANTDFISIGREEVAEISDSQWEVLKTSHFMDSVEVVNPVEEIRPNKRTILKPDMAEDTLKVEKI